MLDVIFKSVLTGQMKGIVLLAVAAVLFLYFLPSILAFARGQKRFWIILVLNIVLTFLQSAILLKFFPGLFVIAPGDLIGMIFVGAIANFGPGWAALLFWALQPGDPDPRLVRAQDTKLYDAIVALPLVLWFAYGAWQIRPYIINDILLITTGRGSLFAWVQLFSLTAALGFNLLLIYLLLVRDKPVRKSRGWLPRLCAVLGTFLGVGLLHLPVAQLTLGMQLLAALLMGVGSLASLLVLWRLGKSFSIMPEARTLVTTGPYAHARHPLYAVEMITIVGMALQFAQPWATLLTILVLAFLVLRTVFEERVLVEAFPDYVAYRAKTARFIPGLI